MASTQLIVVGITNKAMTVSSVKAMQGEGCGGLLKAPPLSQARTKARRITDHCFLLPCPQVALWSLLNE